MDATNSRLPSNKLLLSPATLSAPSATRHQQSDWPAYDRPPHYYASQNQANCNVKMMISQAANETNGSQRQRDQRRSAAAGSGDEQLHEQNSLLASIQRKLFAFIFVYAILVVSLYLTYLGYSFLAHQTRQQQQAALKTTIRSASAQELRSAAASDLFAASTTPESLAAELQSTAETPTKLETKMMLLERYMELIAIDLQETKEKLREREKCDCSLSCHFNGTRYEDRSSWQNQCDICTCQMGKISCQPKKCPRLQCADFVTLPGQCCPTCMRPCKYNNMLIRHGAKFTPTKAADQRKNQTKVCQCLDGLIKCEQPATTKKRTATATAASSQEGDKAVPAGSNGLAVGRQPTTPTPTPTPTISDPSNRLQSMQQAVAGGTNNNSRRDQVAAGGAS